MPHMLPILIVLLRDLGYSKAFDKSRDILAKYYWQSMALATLVTKLIKAREVHVEWPGRKLN